MMNVYGMTTDIKLHEITSLQLNKFDYTDLITNINCQLSGLKACLHNVNVIVLKWYENGDTDGTRRQSLTL